MTIRPTNKNLITGYKELLGLALNYKKSGIYIYNWIITFGRKWKSQERFKDFKTR